MKITPALLRRWRLPALDTELGKEARGKVLVVGGSNENPGAIILAALGTLRAGAGTLQIATAPAVAKHVAVAIPEAQVVGRVDRAAALLVDTLLVGPGMDEPPRALLRACEKMKGTLVVDAGALPAFDGARPPHIRRVILTPHAGEMASLSGVSKEVVLARPEEIARTMARKLGAVVALKGARTYVASPDGRTWLNTAGNLGLGTSGSGDTLSGVIAGLCARGATPEQAAVWGVYLHARAGDVLARTVGPLGFLARELLIEIPKLLARLEV